MADNILGELGPPRESRLGSVVATLGILAVIAGAVALAFPTATAFVVTLAVGAIVAVAGIVHFIDGLRGPDRHWLESILGVLYIGLGVLMFLSPIGGVLSLAVLLSFLLWAGGAFRIAAALTGEAHHRWLAALGGLCALALGFLLMWSPPSQAIWTLGLFAGIELLFSGLSMIRISRVIVGREHALTPQPPDRQPPIAPPPETPTSA